MAERGVVPWQVWLPCLIAGAGMTAYLGSDMWLSVKGELGTAVPPKNAKDFVPENQKLLHVARYFHFRAAALLALTAAMAGSVAAVALLIRYVTQDRRRWHLFALALLVALALLLMVYSPSGMTAQLKALACDSAAGVGKKIYLFCQSSDVHDHILGLKRNLRQFINLPMTVASVCIGYTAFSLALDTRPGTTVETREKLVAILVGFGATLLVSATLLDREYAKWALAGSADKAAATLVDGMTFYSAVLSSALLGMIWLLAYIILVARGPRRSANGNAYLFSRSTSLFGILSVVAPILFATLERSFG